MKRMSDDEWDRFLASYKKECEQIPSWTHDPLGPARGVVVSLCFSLIFIAVIYALVTATR